MLLHKLFGVALLLPLAAGFAIRKHLSDAHVQELRETHPEMADLASKRCLATMISSILTGNKSSGALKSLNQWPKHI